MDFQRTECRRRDGRLFVLSARFTLFSFFEKDMDMAQAHTVAEQLG